MNVSWALYVAHWMYVEVAFRFPKDAVDVKALRRYAGGHTFDVRMTAGDVVFAISVESDGERRNKRTRQEREERTVRECYLTGLAKRERQAWERVDSLIGAKRPGEYAAAATLLVDLRDINGRNRRAAAFVQRPATIRTWHAKKPALLARLAKAGL